MARNEILKIISSWDTLTLSGSEEVLHNRVCVVSEGDLDWALEAVNIPASRVSTGRWPR